MTDHIDRDDVSAMRREGDLKAFLREGIRQGQGVQRANLRQFQQQSTKPPADLPDATGHVPGAWPIPSSDADGTQRTTCPGCARCRSYGKGQPEPAELLRRTQDHLDSTEGTE